MQPLRIWFNRSYPTTYSLLQQLRDNPDGVDVQLYATHGEAASAMLAAADVAELEPALTGEAYVVWALALCARHGIQVFFPNNQQQAIAEAAGRFEAAGVRVVLPPAATVGLFANKVAAYGALTAVGLPLPPYSVADSAASLAEAQAALVEAVGPEQELALKPVAGVGGAGFRVLTTRAYELSDLAGTRDPRVNLQTLLAAYERAEAAGEHGPALMLMPRLGEPEISVDMLTSRDGRLLSAIPRIKGARAEEFASGHAVLDYVQRLHGLQPFAYLSNAQFMWWQDQPVLLEVNTRPSGGLAFTSELTGVNYVWEAVWLALGYEPRLLQPNLEGSFAQIPVAVRLRDLDR